MASTRPVIDLPIEGELPSLGTKRRVGGTGGMCIPHRVYQRLKGG
jgi:hypothetical protein